MVFATLATAHAEDAKIALIIDDIGYQLQTGRRVLGLPEPVAVAVLPHTPFGAVLATDAMNQSREVLIHMPMQAVSATANPGPRALHAGLSESEFKTRVHAALDSIPEAIGVSNHMGSMLTRDETAMNWLMTELAADGSLLFVDSYTTHLSVGLMSARAHGIPALKRDVFLDTDPAPDAIAAAWNRLVDLARNEGFAVGIGHPYDTTLDFLEVILPNLDGVTLVLLTDIANRASGGQQSYLELTGWADSSDRSGAVH